MAPLPNNQLNGFTWKQGQEIIFPHGVTLLLEVALLGSDLSMGIFFQIELPGIFTPPDETGHPPSSMATPWSDSGRANTDSSQPHGNIELPTCSKTGWWEKGKAPFSLP